MNLPSPLKTIKWGVVELLYICIYVHFWQWYALNKALRISYTEAYSSLISGITTVTVCLKKLLFAANV